MSYLNLRKEEYHSTIYGFIYSFLIVGLFILSKSLRDSLFLNNFTKQDLSYLYLITPIISGILVWLILAVFKKIKLFKKSLIIHFVLFIISIILLLNPNNVITLNSILDLFASIQFSNLTVNNSRSIKNLIIFLFKKNNINHSQIFNNAKLLI